MGKWRYESTSRSVDVDLDEFRNEQLLQALIDAKWLSEAEALAIVERANAKDKLAKVIEQPAYDTAELAEARDYLRRGDGVEARLHLERALGRDWYGALF